jgi:flagellar basal-body rod protein FlgB
MKSMALSDIPLFSMLTGRMSYLSERQKVISENVANADSPGYTPHDLKPYSFQAQVQAQSQPQSPMVAGVQAMTQPGHMQAANARGGAQAQAKAVKSKDSETTLDGNSVVLEEEMMKMTESRINYEAAVSFYQKSLGMLKTAMRSPSH